jgi:hypothetical protein
MNIVLTAAVALSNVVSIQSIVDSAADSASAMVREGPALARTTESARIAALSSRRRTVFAHTNSTADQVHHLECSVTAVEMVGAFAPYAMYVLYIFLYILYMCEISHDSFVRNAIVLYTGELRDINVWKWNNARPQPLRCQASVKTVEESICPGIPATYNHLCAEFRHRWLHHRQTKKRTMRMDWIFPHS